MTREEIRAVISDLQREHRKMGMANRYIQHGQASRVGDIGIEPSEVDRIVAAGGYTSDEFTKMRDKIKYHRKKLRRRRRG